jgi:cobalt-zinc-cadmium efflux system membrane fusion protein
MKNIIIFIIAISIFGCNNSEVPSTETTNTEARTDTSGSEAQHQVHVPVGSNIESFATVTVSPDQIISFYTHTPAMVSEIHVMPGQKIKKGDPLYQLESMQLIEMQQQYQTAIARQKSAKLEMERFKDLKESQSVSNKSYELTEEAFETAQSQANALEMMLRLNGLDVTAIKNGKIQPAVVKRSAVNGFVRTVNINKGDFVEGNKTILTIVDATSLYFEINVQANISGLIKPGTLLEYSTLSNNDWKPGSVHIVGGAIDALNNTLLIIGKPTSENDLIIGEKLMVRFINENE